MFFHEVVSLGDGPIRNRARSARHERSYGISALGDMFRVPTLAKTVHERRRKGVARTDGISYGDMKSGSLAILPVIEDGAAPLSKRHAHRFAPEAVGPTAAKILDGVTGAL